LKQSINPHIIKTFIDGVGVINVC